MVLETALVKESFSRETMFEGIVYNASMCRRRRFFIRVTSSPHPGIKQNYLITKDRRLSSLSRLFHAITYISSMRFVDFLWNQDVCTK
jgi:hypothetical protein